MKTESTRGKLTTNQIQTGVCFSYVYFA